MIKAPLSRRLNDLCRRAAATIPCWPDDAVTRAELDELDLPDLLVAYVNYADRVVPPRPDDFWNARAEEHRATLSSIEGKIRRGDDLGPHLSELLRTHGFVAARRRSDRPKKALGPTWDDKDFALNAYEAHHLHLSTKVRSDGLVERTDDLLYVGFSRDAAVMVMVGDHKSFDDGSLAAAVARWRAANTTCIVNAKPSVVRTFDDERKLARRGVTTIMAVNDKVLLNASVSTSGHRTLGVLHALKSTRMLEHVDPQLDDPAFVASVWGDNASRLPERPQFNWYLEYADLLLMEEVSKTATRLVTGHR
ncbi:MAG: hypothetical protein K2X43_18130 [Hyphomonadaceae bacterium]|jgi:hypothetical protein|nr:hypothetical protein [Hyphomonadaceae bacterium]